MPNFIAHYYFSNEVYKEMPEDAKSIVDKCKDAYKLGSIGPDLLFVLRELKKSRYANKMQYRYIKKTFEECGKALRKSKDEIKLSYMLGLINHYSLDREMHAFVNHNVEEYLPAVINHQYQNVTHALTESAIDEDILENKMKENTRKFSVTKVFKAERKVKLSIGELYQKVINKVYGYEFSKKTIARCFDLSRIFVAFMKPTATIRIAMFKNFDKRSHNKMFESMVRPPHGYKKYDYLNENKRKWRIVRNEEKTVNRSFYEQFEECKKTCLLYIKDFMNFLMKGIPLRMDYSINYEGIRISE